MTKERPISLSARWVEAILDRRKTQTRRICDLTKHQNMPVCRYGHPGDGVSAVYRAGSPADTPGPWKPSRFMPKWASRISLRITAIRTEGLQVITDRDTKAEGVEGVTAHVRRVKWVLGWNAINKQPGRTWDDNPNVWVITFEVEGIKQ